MNDHTSVSHAGTSRSIDWLERLAVTGSLACIVHCLALPLVVAALPAVGAMLSIPESVHLWILAFALPCAVVSLAGGRRTHKVGYPSWLGAAGIVCLAAGALALSGTPSETPITVLGSLMLAVAHIANWRLRHATRGDCG